MHHHDELSRDLLDLEMLGPGIDDEHRVLCALMYLKECIVAVGCTKTQSGVNQHNPH